MSVSHRWVSFDCFGTLGRLAGVVRRGNRARWARHAAGDIMRGYHAHERVVEREYPQRSYKDVLVTALVRATAERGVRLTLRMRGAMLMRGWTSMRLFDDVEAMLAELRSRGYRLAVLTNCDEELFSITHRLFRGAVRSGSHGRACAGLQAGAMALPRVREADARRQAALGARGQQLVPRHCAGARARRETRVARSRSDR